MEREVIGFSINTGTFDFFPFKTQYPGERLFR
jgi:hypothetical protein